MRTDELIGLLSAHLEPVDSRKLARSIGLAIGVGSVLSLALILFAFGVRPDLANPNAQLFVAIKLAFTVGIVAAATACVSKLARPGADASARIALIALPFFAMLAAAILKLTGVPTPDWAGMMLRGEWLDCLISIPAIAVIPFATIVFAVRAAAPTDLKRTGAVVGLVAGAISATAYALHCTSDSLPFITLWYGGTIGLCAVAGTVLGPSLLRW